MIYPCITVTGADEKTPIEILKELDAEIGLLYTETPNGRNRYPSKDWIIETSSQIKRLAIHICGSKAREQLVSRRLDDFVQYSQRIQVNGTLTLKELNTICKRYPDKIIITQFNNSNHTLTDLDLENHSMLVDSSGGRGKSPESWIRPDVDKPIGFAGGLGPDNLREELSKMPIKNSWWVDMEGKLRDNDWFSVEKASEVIKIFNERKI